MLQSMLASRFGLIAHLETKELPSYDLVVRKEGLKIHPAVAADHRTEVLSDSTAIRGKAISMARLAGLWPRKPTVLCSTRPEVSGVFDIDLKWAADADTDPGPSVFTGSPGATRP